MNPNITVFNEAKLAAPNIKQLCRWALQTLASEQHIDAELSICIVDASESQQLNKTYRGNNKPTNVLSFPADIPSELNLPILGDIVICHSVVEQEAKEFNLPLEMRWAHMVVHGTLHLLGFDHIDSKDAYIMESKETQLLKSWGYNNPYSVSE